MQKLHVLLTHQALDRSRLAGKVVVVLDVVFATTSIVAALAAGARAVWPAATPEAARAVAARLPAGRVRLAGEQHVALIPGFESPFPLDLERGVRAGDELVYVTTNGTVALGAARGAAAVYAAALVNLGATVEHLLAAHREQTILLLCAGSAGRVNVEDTLGAGLLVRRLTAARPFALTDAARVASAAAAACAYPARALREAALGRVVAQLGKAADLDFAAAVDRRPLVARLDADGERVTALTG